MSAFQPAVILQSLLVLPIGRQVDDVLTPLGLFAGVVVISKAFAIANLSQYQLIRRPAFAFVDLWPSSISFGAVAAAGTFYEAPFALADRRRMTWAGAT